MTVEERAGAFIVIEDDEIVAHGFATCAAAWRWIDRREGEPISKSEQRTEWSWNKRVHGE